MTQPQNTLNMTMPSVIRQFSFDVISLTGDESIDFLQRISTNEFDAFVPGFVQKTLLVTEKGKIVDTVWVIHRKDQLLMLTSKGMASEILTWLNKYIIMEEIVLHDVSDKFDIDVHFKHTDEYYKTDYFGFPVSLEVKARSSMNNSSSTGQFERWRIENGIPKIKKEIVSEFNPLELNLWSWISFSKGCYIGQEVIARLDTYNKIQRLLCKISSNEKIAEHEMIINNEGTEIGKITSVIHTGEDSIGLAVIRMKFAVEQMELITLNTHRRIKIDKVFGKELHGRN